MMGRNADKSSILTRPRKAGLFVLALCLLLSDGLSAQFTTFTPTATPTPLDEVYRIIVVKDVGDKEGRDNRLMLETLGYIPVHMLGDFGSGKGTVLLGNFPTQKEAQKMKEQLVRDGFLPLDIVKVRRHSHVDSVLTVLVDWFDQQSAAESVRDRLIALGMIQVKASHDTQTGKYCVTVGYYHSIDQAFSVVANLKDVHGLKNAQVVQTDDFKKVVSQEATSSPRPRTSEEMKEIERLVSLKLMQEERQKAGGGRDSDVEEEIARLNEKLIAVNKGPCAGSQDNAPMSEEQLQAANRRKRIAELFRDANELARMGNNEAALVKIREILAMDPENAIAIHRERALQVSPEQCYDFSPEAIEKKYLALRAKAQEAAKKNTIPELIVAKGFWGQIQVLHDRFESEAQSRINALNKRIKRLHDRSIEN